MTSADDFKCYESRPDQTTSTHTKEVKRRQSFTEKICPSEKCLIAGKIYFSVGLNNLLKISLPI